MEIDRNGLEILTREQCLELLGTAIIGRVGLTSGALPTILPVNFRLDRDQILIRSGQGLKLDAALQDAVVAFEADDFNPIDHSGWSVAVTGVARAIIDEGELHALDAVPIARWAPRGNGSIVAISTDMISGRRLGHGRRAPRRTMP